MMKYSINIAEIFLFSIDKISKQRCDNACYVTLVIQKGGFTVPPTPRISKEQVMEAAFAIARTEGINLVNARYLAKHLNCSTQPIFRVYENMESLKDDIANKAGEYYNLQMMKVLTHPFPFLGMGLAYVEFAKTEKQLFKLLFLNDAFTIRSFEEMIKGEQNQQIIELIAGATQISAEQAKRVFLSIWLLMHGMATMIATNSADIPATEVEDILTKGFYGFLAQEKKGPILD